MDKANRTTSNFRLLKLWITKTSDYSRFPIAIGKFKNFNSVDLLFDKVFQYQVDYSIYTALAVSEVLIQSLSPM